MSAVFAETSFYLALLDERDTLHKRALAESRMDRPILTPEFIVLELGNACGRAEDHADFLALLAGMRASPRTTIVPLDSGQWGKRKGLVPVTPGETSAKVRAAPDLIRQRAYQPGALVRNGV